MILEEATVEHKDTYTAKELIDLNITEMPFLLDGIFQKSGLAALVGTSDVGKSTLLRDLAASIAIGEPEFLGIPLNTTHQRVLYVSSEDDPISLSYFFCTTKDEDFKAKPGLENLEFIFDTRELESRLEILLPDNKYDLIIVDAFGDVYPYGMNNYNEVRNFLEPYYRLATNHECLILFLHHTGKRTENLKASKNNILGSQGFEGKMRVVLELRSDPYSSIHRHLLILKGNYIDSSEKSHSIKLSFQNREFINTGQRVHINEIVPSKGTKEEKWFPTLSELYNQDKEDKTVDQYLELLNELGADVGRSSVGNWLKVLRDEEE